MSSACGMKVLISFCTPSLRRYVQAFPGYILSPCLRPSRSIVSKICSGSIILLPNWAPSLCERRRMFFALVVSGISSINSVDSVFCKKAFPHMAILWFEGAWQPVSHRFQLPFAACRLQFLSAERVRWPYW